MAQMSRSRLQFPKIILSRKSHAWIVCFWKNQSWYWSQFETFSWRARFLVMFSCVPWLSDLISGYTWNIHQGGVVVLPISLASFAIFESKRVPTSQRGSWERWSPSIFVQGLLDIIGSLNYVGFSWPSRFIIRGLFVSIMTMLGGAVEGVTMV